MTGESGGGHGVTAGVWMVVAVMIAGSIMMGVALIEWVWPVFWVGVGLVVAAGIGGIFTNIMDQVTEFIPALPPEADPS